VETAKNNTRNKSSNRGIKARNVTPSSVVSVRVSDDDKERINEVMKAFKIRSYSDFMRIALQMVRLKLHSG